MADEILLRNRAAQPAFLHRHAAVGAAVAIVAHQEDAAFGDRIGCGVVDRQVLDVEHGIALAVRHGFLELLVAALALAVGADLLELDLIAGQRIVGARRVDHVRGHGDDEIGHRLTLQRLAVDPHDAAAHLNRVAGQADHALDPVVLVLRRCLEDDDVAALGRAREDVAGDQRDAERQAVFRIAIGHLVDEQIVADQQPRLHRFRGNVERRQKEAAKDQHRDREQREKADRVDRFFLGGDGGRGGGGGGEWWGGVKGVCVVRYLLNIYNGVFVEKIIVDERPPRLKRYGGNVERRKKEAEKEQHRDRGRREKADGVDFCFRGGGGGGGG